MCVKFKKKRCVFDKRIVGDEFSVHFVSILAGSITISARQTVVSGGAEADSFTSQDDLINDDIDLSYVYDNALRFTGSQTMTGQVDFTNDLTVGTAVTVSGDINSITVPGELKSVGEPRT